MKPWIWLAVIALAAAVAWFLLRRRGLPPGLNGGDRQAARLFAEYRRLSHLSRVEAADALDRHVEALREKQPGQSLEWYIAHAVEELRADKRR